MPGTTGHESFKKVRKNILKTILSILVLALVAVCAQDMQAKKKTRKSTKARTTSVQRKKSKSRKGVKVRNRRRSSATTTRRVTPVKPLIIRGHDSIVAPGARFVTFERPSEITEGLDGRVIALWPSHGYYFNTATNGWSYQRPRLFTTLEDLFSHTFATAYLTPMLENAGAYVMLPRERDFSPYEVIADYDGMDAGEYSIADGRFKWEELPDSTGYSHPSGALSGYDNPFRNGTADVVTTVPPSNARHASHAYWNVNMPERGHYAVYVSYASLPNSATDAHYTVNHLGGSTNVTVNQQMGGGTWVYLGSYDFDKGMQVKPVVELSNISSDEESMVSADAVKVGGGMGSVSRSLSTPGFTSGKLKANEGSGIYLQSAGMPRYVWQPNMGESDYKDDYMSRAHWANYLAGGSSIFPDTLGLGIPVDMAFAFHTDAGVTHDGTTVGTLGLYSTDDGNPFGNGSARSANGTLTRNVHSAVVNDLRALYDPAWNSRSYRDRKYYEVRETKMPAMILEALSHQNYEDMRRGLDPEFKFILSRAVYKGILKFLAGRYGTPWVVQPLPVKDFAIHYTAPGKYRLTWEPRPDRLEPTAMPGYYIVEERLDDGGFEPVATVDKPVYDVEIDDEAIHSYRIIAGNAGGTAFPSEVLSLYDNDHKPPVVTIVNGFTRVAAPGLSKEGKGFDFNREPAIAAGMDIGTCGPEFNFDEYTSDWGASSGTLENQTFAGNTFDFTTEHGEPIRNAGYGYVSTSASAYAASASTPADTPVVDLILGLQKTDERPGSGEKRHEPFPQHLRERLRAHRAKGGALLATGSYIGSDLLKAQNDSTGPVPADSIFAAEVLGITQAASGAVNSSSATMEGGRIPAFYASTVDFQSRPDRNHYGVTLPDAIYPADEKDVVMRYNGSGLPAAVISESAAGDKSRIFVAGFPLEAVTDATARDLLMRAALKYLLEKH